VTLFKKSFLQ